MTGPRRAAALLVSGLALPAILALGGCSSDARGSGVTIALDLSALTGPAADPGTPMVDDLGLADLSLFPLFLVVRVEADDLDAPVVAAWPEEVPADVPGAVEVEVEVEPGPDRRVSVELVYADEEGLPTTFVAPEPGGAPPSVDVTADETTDLEVSLTELDDAPVRATWPSGEPVASVAWVDDRAGAALPPRPAEGGAIEGTLSVGRTYWPRVALEDGSVVNLDAQRVRPDGPGELVEVELDLD